jgi:hypothetical protein
MVLTEQGLMGVCNFMLLLCLRGVQGCFILLTYVNVCVVLRSRIGRRLVVHAFHWRAAAGPMNCAPTVLLRFVMVQRRRHKCRVGTVNRPLPRNG